MVWAKAYLVLCCVVIAASHEDLDEVQKICVDACRMPDAMDARACYLDCYSTITKYSDLKKLRAMLSGVFDGTTDLAKAMEKKAVFFGRVGKRPSYFSRVGKREEDGSDEILDSDISDLDKRPSFFSRVGKRPSFFSRVGKRPSFFSRVGKRPSFFSRVGKRPSFFSRVGKRPSFFSRVGRSPDDDQTS